MSSINTIIIGGEQKNAIERFDNYVDLFVGFFYRF